MSAEKINFIDNDVLTTGTRLALKSVEGSPIKNTGSPTPPGPCWYIYRSEGLSFSLLLPKGQNVLLKWKIAAWKADYWLEVNDTKGEVRKQRDEGSTTTPYTEHSWDISSYVREGNNTIKLTRTREGDSGPLSINEVSVEITQPEAYPNGNIEIDGIEVTQAIQNIVTHDVPLIENKKTAARIYLTVPEAMSAGKLTGELKITKGDETYHAYSEGSLDVTNANQDALLKKRENINNSLNFLLPEGACSGEVDVTLDGLYADIGENSYSVNIGTSANRSVSFEKAPPLRLRVIGLRHKDQEDPDCPEQPRQIDYDLIKSWLGRAFPVPDVEFSRIVTDTPRNFSTPFINHRFKVWAQVAAIRHLDMAFGSIDRRTHYYGLAIDHRRMDSDENYKECCHTFLKGAGELEFYADPTLVAAGPTGTPWVTKVGPGGEETQDRIDLITAWDNDASFGDWYAAHELGHNLGRLHTFIPISGYPYANGKIGDTGRPYIGFDVGDESLNLERQAMPYNKYSDVMSYNLFRWVSDHTYKAILTRLKEEDVIGQDGKGSGCAVKFEEGIFISVIVLKKEIVYVNPVSGGFVRTASSHFNTKLRIHYQSSDESLPADRRDRQEDTQINRGMHSIDFIDWAIKLNLRDKESVSKIEYLEDEQVKSTYIVPPNVDSIDTVKVAADVEGVRTVTWKTTGEDAVFNVQASRDNGSSWETLAVGLNEKSFDIETNLFAGFEQWQAKVRVMATNGVEAKFSPACWLTSEREPGSDRRILPDVL